MISVLIDPSLEYPDAGDFFSPDERFPEYRYESISAGRNDVYRAVREIFIQADLDRENVGTPHWNPLKDFIRPGDRVFLLCNFMQERRRDESVEDFRSRCSHGSVIRAVADYVLIAAGERGHVAVGNAPIQFCDWDAVLRDTETDRVLEFYATTGAPVVARDLRLVVTSATSLGSISSVERGDEGDGVHVALDGASLISELDGEGATRYRVMNYDPRRTESFHSSGHHEYVISRHILESDVVFSLPKLKTHEKTGITCAVKGMVGTVAHKDSLPHHRYGPPDMGGDEYPSDATRLTRAASWFHERVQHTRPETTTGSLLRAAHKIYRRLTRRWSPVVDGAWHGNDTTWRMAVDVARAATYADPTGVLHQTPRRKHVVLTDGIIGGEGDGPYRSTAVHSGILTLSDDLAVADHVNALLMGFSPDRMPIVRESARSMPYPLTRVAPLSLTAEVNGRLVPVAEIAQAYGSKYEAQDGWKDVLA